MKNRFDFEQEFLSCWELTTDLHLLLEECERIENVEVADHISNIVLGLMSIYDMRFNKAWNSFEESIKDDDKLPV